MQGLWMRQLSYSTINQWTENDVGEWLASVGLQDFVATFKENHVRGDALLHLTAMDLAEMGIATVCTQKQLLKTLWQLKAAAQSSNNTNLKPETKIIQDMPSKGNKESSNIKSKLESKIVEVAHRKPDREALSIMMCWEGTHDVIQEVQDEQLMPQQKKEPYLIRQDLRATSGIGPHKVLEHVYDEINELLWYRL